MTTAAPRDPRRTWLVVLIVLGLVLLCGVIASALIFENWFLDTYHATL